jgi:hypothetical protein
MWKAKDCNKMTEEQQEYIYTSKYGAEWWRKTPPARNLFFEKELERLAGKNTFNQPILRVVWGGTHKSDVAARDTLKYKILWKGVVAYSYIDENDEIRTVRPDSKDIPAGAIVMPIEDTIELGNTRWYVEKWQSIEDAVENGRFGDQLGEDGQRLFREPPSEGVYNAWMLIQSADGHYRELDNAVLEEVKAQWCWNEKTLDEKIADLQADEKQAEKEKRAAASAAWHS